MTEARLKNCDEATFHTLKVVAEAPLLRIFTPGHRKIISIQHDVQLYTICYYWQLLMEDWWLLY